MRLKRPWGCRLVALGLVLTLAAVLAPGASAVVVRLGNGHSVGVTPRQGVNPATLRPAVSGPRAANRLSINGNLDYHGGPVLHSSKPYLIFWTPSGESIPAGSQSLLGRYFTDVAGDSGKATDVYAVNRQFTDASGFADYQQTYSSSQAIVDTHAYPTSGNCTRTNSTSYPTCITDGQLQSEISRLIAAQSLPSGTGPNAPIYFVVLPTDVNVCVDSSTCSDNVFCAYHSAFNDGGHSVLYSAIPTLLASLDPKGCQVDGNNPPDPPQEPNSDLADVVIKYLSHEDNETITDPVLNAWFDNITGNENGDNCNSVSDNANAFTPTVGGSASAGTLYNQLINSNKYYTQGEWSNGDTNCELQPSTGTVTPRFTVSSGPVAASPVSFDPSTSTSTHTFSSATWDFGDGAATTFHPGGSTLTSASHTYANPGSYTVTLTLVDDRGNLAQTSHTVVVDEHPTASFAVTTAQPGSGQPVSFDGSSSFDGPSAGSPDGSISSYAWSFGDGSPGATGATPSHTYPTPGTYAVTLTVTDTDGHTSSTTQQVVIQGPTAAFTFSPGQPMERVGVRFDGGSSPDSQAGVSITSYAWTFGDGSAGSGATPNHTYAAPGTYTVTLTVTDADGRTDTSSRQLTVLDELPTAAFLVLTTHPAAKVPVSLDASSARDSDGSIASYAWNYGDGTTGTGAKPAHTYSHAGTYTVTLTITDSSGLRARTSHSIVVVRGSRITKVTLRPRNHPTFVLVKLNGAGTLTVGSHRFRVQRAKTVKVRLSLTSFQQLRLRQASPVKVKLTIKFIPLIGAPQARKLTITFRG